MPAHLRDLVLSPEINVSALSPLASSSNSLVPGDIASLILLKYKVLPDPEDDPDGHDSLNDIVKTLFGEEATEAEWKKTSSEPSKSVTDWEGEGRRSEEAIAYLDPPFDSLCSSLTPSPLRSPRHCH